MPRGPRKPVGSHFGANLDPFWTHFWAHSGASCRLLLAFRRLLSLEVFETCLSQGARPKRSQLQPPGEPAQRASKGISD